MSISTLVNEEGLKRGRDSYGPKKLENIVASCKWCYCTQDMHKSGSGKCKFCDQCQGFDTASVKDSKPDILSEHGPVKQ